MSFPRVNFSNRHAVGKNLPENKVQSEIVWTVKNHLLDLKEVFYILVPKAPIFYTSAECMRPVYEEEPLSNFFSLGKNGPSRVE